MAAKITLESTDKTVHVNGVECRLWEGTTERGVPIHAYIALLGIANGLDASELEAELKERRPPSREIAWIPSRLIAD